MSFTDNIESLRIRPDLTIGIGSIVSICTGQISYTATVSDIIEKNNEYWIESLTQFGSYMTHSADMYRHCASLICA